MSELHKSKCKHRLCIFVAYINQCNPSEFQIYEMIPCIADDSYSSSDPRELRPAMRFMPARVLQKKQPAHAGCVDLPGLIGWQHENFGYVDMRRGLEGKQHSVGNIFCFQKGHLLL